MFKALKLALKGSLYTFFILLALPGQFLMIGGKLPAQSGLLTGLAFVLSGALMALAHYRLSDLVQTVQDICAPQQQADWESRYPSNRQILSAVSKYIWLGALSGSSLLIIYLLGNLGDLNSLYHYSIEALLPLTLALILQTFILAPLGMHLHCQALKKGLHSELYN